MTQIPIAILTTFALFMISACTTPIRNQTYVPTAMAQVSDAQARSECQFAVEAATASIGTGRVPKGTSFEEELGDAIADGVIKGDEQNTLFASCMRSKGFIST